MFDEDEEEEEYDFDEMDSDDEEIDSDECDSGSDAEVVSAAARKTMRELEIKNQKSDAGRSKKAADVQKEGAGASVVGAGSKIEATQTTKGDHRGPLALPL